MKMRQIAALAGGTGLLVGVCSLGFSAAPTNPPTQSDTGTGGTQIIAEHEFTLNVPPGITDEGLREAQEAYLAGEPLPAGVTLLDFGGKVDAYLTGIASAQTGAMQVLVTVVDDTDDLDEVRLYFNGALLTSVDHAGGGIVDRQNGKSKATLSAFVPDPASTNPYEVSLEWEGFAAGTSNSTLYRR